MCQRFFKEALQKHKLALHIMPVPKYGKICLTVQKVIYGLLGAFSMKWLHKSLLLLLQTYNPCIKKCVAVFTPESLNNILMIWPQ